MSGADLHTNQSLHAFERLFREHYAALCGFARVYVKDTDAAEEIVQEVFINTWEKRETIDFSGAIKSYLFSSVRNRCLNYIRDHKKFSSYYLDIDIANESAHFDADLLTGAETERQIEAALSKLPEKCRKVFELNRFGELKYKDIAEKLGISVKTVEVHMSKALKILREELSHLLGLFLWIIMRFFN